MKIKIQIKNNKISQPTDKIVHKINKYEKYEPTEMCKEQIDNLVNKYLEEPIENNKTKQDKYEDKNTTLKDNSKNNEKKQKKKKKNSIPFRNYLVYLVILTSLSACVTFSRYATQMNLRGSDAVVAKFDVTMEETSEIEGKQLFFENSNFQKISFDGYLNKNAVSYDKACKIINNSEVPIKLSLSSITGNDNFSINILFGNNDIYQNEMILGIGQTAYVKFVITPSNSNVKTSDDIKIIINASQVD